MVGLLMEEEEEEEEEGGGTTHTPPLVKCFTIKGNLDWKNASQWLISDTNCQFLSPGALFAGCFPMHPSLPPKKKKRSSDTYTPSGDHPTPLTHP